jgi:hypothetical protein
LPSNPHEKEKNENTKSFQSHIMVEVKSIRVSEFMRSMRFLGKTVKKRFLLCHGFIFHVSCGRRCLKIGWLPAGVGCKKFEIFYELEAFERRSRILEIKVGIVEGWERLV